MDALAQFKWIGMASMLGVMMEYGSRSNRDCKNGHELKEETTYIHHGGRVCKICHAKEERERRYKK
jgi:hypothetical protein